MKHCRLGLAVLCVLAGGVCIAQADNFDYQYGYDPQSHAFVPIFDPLSYGSPSWDPGTNNMRVPNWARPEPWHKDVSVWIDFTGEGAPSAPPGYIWVMGENGTPLLVMEWALKIDPEHSERGQQWMGKVYLPNQPGYEIIGFAEAGYKSGAPLANGSTVDFITVSTLCVPEPGTLLLLAMGGLLLAWRRRGRA